MLTSSLQVRLSLWQPWHVRVWRRLADAARAAAHAFEERRLRQSDWAALDGLNARALKDIGAPEWVVLDAAERRALASRQGPDRFSPWRCI